MSRVRAKLANLEAKVGEVVRAKRRIPAIRIYDATIQSEEEIQADIDRRVAEAGYVPRPGDPIHSIIVDPYPDDDPEAPMS
jgi:hypothetical protein